MRRKVDGWVNATHILKVANFDKPQRTRILEREVQKGTHEKVQGGYGKYQGTWVPLERAKEIASQYKVIETLEPLFSYTSQANSPPPAPKQVSKAKAASRSASTTSNAPAPKKARKATSMPARASTAKRGRGRPPNSIAAHSTMRSQLSSYEESTVSPLPKNESVADGASLSADSASVSSRSSSPSDFMSDSDIDAALGNGHPAMNRAVKSGDMRYRYANGELHDHSNTQTPQIQNHAQFMDSDMLAQEYSNKLLDYFMAPDDDKIPDFLIHPPAGFKINQVIDDEGHTAFHWACAMGHIKIIEILLQAGADMNAVNLAGETPLIRSIMFTNNYDRRTFPKVVDLLRDTIFYVDPNKQTVLHHIANTTSSRSKLSSTRYYVEILLAKISETQPMGYLTNFLDRQDVNDDTSLHIAARNCARKCVKVLLSYNASSDILNNQGRTASDYIYQDEAQRQLLQHQREAQMPHLKSSSSPVLTHQGLHERQYGSLNAANNNNNHDPGVNNNAWANGSIKIISQGGEHANGSSQNQPIQPSHSTNTEILPHQHVSESAINISQHVVPFMVDLLESLATAYDSELKDKDADMEQVRQLLENMKRDIVSTEQSIEELQQRLGDESQMNAKVRESNSLVESRLVQVIKYIERTQALELAGLVQDEESKVDFDINDNSYMITTLSVELARELSQMQNERKQLIDDIAHLYARAGVGEKMNNYRKLVSISCGVNFDEIDDLLDGIAQALMENNGDECLTLE